MIEYKSIQKLSNVDKISFMLINKDARYFYTLLKMVNDDSCNPVIFCMSLSYMGLFTYESVKWLINHGFNIDFPDEQTRKFYRNLRLSIKLMKKGYESFSKEFNDKLKESHEYFRNTSGVLKYIIGINDIGIDYYNDYCCGNSIIYSVYLPFYNFENKDYSCKLSEYASFSGHLCSELYALSPYAYNDIKIYSKDYNIKRNPPYKLKNEFGFILFNILCQINFAIELINEMIVEEIPLKFKVPYLIYYELCKFIPNMNYINNVQLKINKSLKDQKFRNCIAHYDLSKDNYMVNKDIIPDDPLYGLTNKAFNKDYKNTKDELYGYLCDVRSQIMEFLY